MYSEKDAIEELGEYGHIPEHERDRESFRCEQMARARQLLEIAAECEMYRWWTQKDEPAESDLDLTA